MYSGCLSQANLHILMSWWLVSHKPTDIFIISPFLIIASIFWRPIFSTNSNFCAPAKFLPNLLPFLQFLAPSSSFWPPAPNDSFHVQVARCKRELGAPVSHTWCCAGLEMGRRGGLMRGERRKGYSDPSRRAQLVDGGGAWTLEAAKRRRGPSCYSTLPS